MRVGGGWCVVCGVWYCSDIAGGCFVLATRTDLSLTRRGGFEQGHTLGLVRFLCEVQGRLAVLQMRRGRGRRQEVRMARVRGCRVACGGGRVGESNGGATCSCGQLVVVEGGGV